MLYIVKKEGQEVETRKRHPSPMEGGIEFLAVIDNTQNYGTLRWLVYRGELVRYHDFVINDQVYTLEEVRRERPTPPGQDLRDDPSVAFVRKPI